MKLSIVIPCYHSAGTIGHVARDLCRVVEEDGRYDYELILVNDNPPDDTWDVLRQLVAENAHIRAFCMSRNFGQDAALMACYRQVTGDIVVSLDDDGQNPASEIFKLVDALTERVDIAYGKYVVKKHSPFRNFGSFVNDRMLCWVLDKPKNLYVSSFYAARRFVIDEMVRCQSSFPYVEGLSLRSSKSAVNVIVDHREREQGQSGYTLRKLIGAWMNGLTALSVKPLRITTALGFAIAAFSFLAGIFLAARKLVVGSAEVEGWTSLMLVVLFMGGLIITVVGMVGEYIGRIYLTLNASPQYVLRERCERTAEGEEQ